MREVGGRRSQDPGELATLITLFQREQVRAYLEIGARHGDTFWDVMRALPTGARGVAVDLPNGPWGSSGSESSLRETVRLLHAEGYDAHEVLGDSRAPEVLSAVGALGPYDAVFIDGDHRYYPARADWDHYRSMARLVAFHDIVGHRQHDRQGNLVEIPRLWEDIALLGLRTEVIVSPGSHMGVGVVWTGCLRTG